MASLSEMVAALFGSKEPPAPGTVKYPASQPKEYPTGEDVAFARKQDYSYGQPWAREFTGSNLNVLASDPNEAGMRTSPLSWGAYKTNPELWDVHAKAALASQNSALASLGYDPDKMALDVSRDPKKVNILGMYRRGSRGDQPIDEIYANAYDPSVAVHESIHRGISKLADTPHWKKEFEQYRGGTLPGEYVVRWLMNKKMGDPEGSGGDKDKQQRGFAEYLYGQDKTSAGDRRRAELDAMEAAAAKALAEKRPRGPR